MAILLSAVEIGKCYLTNTGRVWRIMRFMPDGRVQYEHRPDRHSEQHPAPGMLTALPAEVVLEREVPCDWIPDVHEGGAAGSLSPATIQVGRCYLTEGGIIRKVTSTGSDGVVRYRERVSAGPWLGRGSRRLKRQDFAAAVVREVPCDEEPEENGTE